MMIIFRGPRIFISQLHERFSPWDVPPEFKVGLKLAFLLINDGKKSLLLVRRALIGRESSRVNLSYVELLSRLVL